MPANRVPFKRQRTVVMILCWMAYIVTYLLRSNLSIALPYIEAAYNVNKTELGFLSSAFLWVYGTGQLVNGYFGDRFSAKSFIGIGILMSAAGNVMFGLMHLFWLMAVCWAVNGWFSSMLWGPIAKTVSIWYPAEKSGAIVIAISTSTAVGVLASLLLSGSLAGHETWRLIFYAPAVIAGGFLILHFLFFRNVPSASATAAEKHNSRNDRLKTSPSLLQIILKTRIRYAVIACFSQAVIKDAIFLWSAVFFIETYALDVKSAALTIVLIPVMNLLGVIAVGWFYRRYSRRLERLTACTFGIGVVFILLFLIFGRSSLALALVFLALTSCAMYGANTLLLGIFPLSFAHCGRVSSVAGFLEFCAYLASGFSAVISGFLVDRIGWNSAAGMWLGVAVIGMTALIMAEKSSVSYEIPDFREASAV